MLLIVPHASGACFALALCCIHDTTLRAGADCLGYYAGIFSPDGSIVAANGFTGALHCWRLRDKRGPPTSSPTTARSSLPQSPSGGESADAQGVGAGASRMALAQPLPAAVGHCGAVVDACWGVDGECLLTASADQTLRVAARDLDGAWYEFARPQVHGHDFHALVAIPHPEKPGLFMFASASEEKVIRVFVAPHTFVQSLALLRGAGSDSAYGSASGGILGATVPALGLSNTAVMEGDVVDAQGEGEGAMVFGNAPDFAPNQAPAVVQVRAALASQIVPALPASVVSSVIWHPCLVCSISY